MDISQFFFALAFYFSRLSNSALHITLKSPYSLQGFHQPLYKRKRRLYVFDAIQNLYSLKFISIPRSVKIIINTTPKTLSKKPPHGAYMQTIFPI